MTYMFQMGAKPPARNDMYKHLEAILGESW